MRFAALLAFALLACEEGRPCPEVELEIRAFTGDAVAGTSVTCDPFQFNALCGGDPNFGPPLARAASDACGSERLFVTGDDPIRYHAVMFFLDRDGDLPTRVRAQEESACDDEGCELEATPIRSGWIMPEHGPWDGTRHSGRFSVQLTGYLITGDYDTSAP